MEADEGPQIVLQLDPDGYRVGSIDHPLDYKKVVDESKLKDCVIAFCQSVRLNTRELIGIDAVEAVMP